MIRDLLAQVVRKLRPPTPTPTLHERRRAAMALLFNIREPDLVTWAARHVVACPCCGNTEKKQMSTLCPDPLVGYRGPLSAPYFEHIGDWLETTETWFQCEADGCKGSAFFAPPDVNPDEYLELL